MRSKVLVDATEVLGRGRENENNTEGHSLKEGLSSVLFDELVGGAAGDVGDGPAGIVVAAGVCAVVGHEGVAGGGQGEDDSSESTEHVGRQRQRQMQM